MKSKVFSKILATVLFGFSLVLGAAPAHAAQWTFDLHDSTNPANPAGKAGLWLKMLSPGASDVHLNFFFSNAGSNLDLIYDDVANTVRIFGQSYVTATDVGTQASLGNGIANIDYTYAGGVSATATGEQIFITQDLINNNGTIQLPFTVKGVNSLNLRDRGMTIPGMENLGIVAFKFLPLLSPQGYWSVDGWLATVGGSPVYTEGDWHAFATRGTDIPEPSTLMLLGCAGIASRLRRRKRAE